MLGQRFLSFSSLSRRCTLVLASQYFSSIALFNWLPQKLKELPLLCDVDFSSFSYNWFATIGQDICSVKTLSLLKQWRC